MKRREFLKTLAFGVIGLGIAPELIAHKNAFGSSTDPSQIDDHIKDYLHKMEHFNKPHKDDIFIDNITYKTFKSTVKRLRRLQGYVGHGNFQVLSLDEARKFARNASQVGEFTSKELRFMEKIFYEEAQRYGFFGNKPLKQFTERIQKKNVYKVPYTGNYLYKGVPLETLERVKRQVGGVMKQFLLFLNKAYKADGNLSLASRSLAPPGYSFHGIGDFDVGQVGFGAANFTEKFTETEIYERLSDLGYLKLRYHEQNLLGVRFEPWHIKINEDI
jgi:hypothetical protein